MLQHGDIELFTHSELPQSHLDPVLALTPSTRVHTRIAGPYYPVFHPDLTAIH